MEASAHRSNVPPHKKRRYPTPPVQGRQLCRAQSRSRRVRAVRRLGTSSSRGRCWLRATESWRLRDRQASWLCLRRTLVEQRLILRTPAMRRTLKVPAQSLDQRQVRFGERTDESGRRLAAGCRDIDQRTRQEALHVSGIDPEKREQVCNKTLRIIGELFVETVKDLLPCKDPLKPLNALKIVRPFANALRPCIIDRVLIVGEAWHSTRLASFHYGRPASHDRI